jgi:Plasmid pRiA4b ORF-3-like protein
MKLHFSDQLILTDFDRFITYLCEHPALPVTNDKAVLKGADLVAINERMMSYQTTFISAKFQQRSFSLLNTFFYIAKLGNFFDINTNQKNGKNTLVVKEKSIKAYDLLGDDEKFFFLLETFWRYLDWEEAYDCRSFWSVDFYKNLTTQLVGKKITVSDRDLKRKGEVEGPSDYFVAELFQAFGFIELHWDINLTARPTKYSFPYESVTLLPLGKTMISILMFERPLYKWNIDNSDSDSLFFFNLLNNKEEDIKEDENKVKENFVDAFLPHFKGLKIENQLIKPPIPFDEREIINGCYYLKVSLAHNLYRIIKIGGNDTFDYLHDAIQDAFDFGNDHLYAFFMDGKRWSRKREVYWSPDADGEVFTTEVVIGSAGLIEGKKFLYLFDFGDSWEFSINVVSIKPEEKEPNEAEIIESVGENPSQYGDDDDE